MSACCLVDNGWEMEDGAGNDGGNGRSGAMESTIRRVVNLRLKGASIYWLAPTSEAMFMLRSYYESGRWNLLKS